MNRITRFFATIFGGFFDNRLWSAVPGGTRSTTANVDVSEDTALNYSAVWCATKLLCGTGAQLPLPVYRGEDDETREKLRDHPVYRLLNIAPNPEQTAFNFRSVLWQWQVNWGNAYAEIVREGGEPEAPVMELWPLHPSRVKPMRDDNLRLYYEVHQFDGTKTELEPWRMLHLPSVITYDGIVGRGVVQHARETIGAGIAAEKKAANWFGGAGVPSVVIEYPGAKWPDEARNAFRKEWKELYGGPDGDAVALLQGGATAKPLSFSAEDSQFLETRQFSVEEVARWYGIPPHLLQHLLRATFNNVEELGIDFVRYGLLSWLEIWEQGIRQKLFTEAEQASLFVEHNVDALMRGNAQARAQFYQAMTSAAIMSRNECRRLENLDPVEGGDVYLVQGAMVPLDDDGKPESAFVTPEQPGGSTVSDPPEDDSGDDPAEDAKSVAGGEQRVKATVTASLARVLAADMSRMLTKEAKAMETAAKKPGKFVDSMESFYAAHRDLLVDVVSPAFDALAACDREVDKYQFVTTWIDAGKTQMLEAAGAATPNELPDAVSRVIQSKTWTERPKIAAEGVCSASL